MGEFEGGASTGTGRLAEVYSPCFSLILQLRASLNVSSADVLRRNVLEVFDECERTARRTAAPQDVEDAKFALVAFVDETILSSTWSMKSQWMAQPLQLQLYNRFDAGEHFFERLDGVLRNASERPEVLEIYYLCLTLGFKGKYQIVEQDKLRSLIDASRSALKQQADMLATALSPNGLPRDQVATEVRSKLPTWAIVAAAIAIGTLIYIGFLVSVERKASRVLDDLQGISMIDKSAAEQSMNIHFKTPRYHA